eukprot:gene26247-biopygen15268
MSRGGVRDRNRAVIEAAGPLPTSQCRFRGQKTGRVIGRKLRPRGG